MAVEQLGTKRKSHTLGQVCDFCENLPRWSVKSSDRGIDDWFLLCDQHLADGILHGLEDGRYKITFARLVR